ncbi:hypothetical protein IEQ34_001536 [Dendrobium chrysotoxum]|uniref:Uncharacterized protein n=1 Tax=Dendrobium chrysotoxum TaxID=161865 RepID=A0AAV7HPI5_DENCH|nr:hypothetical protein IEQ34_001536 [Dendrobium chrysotoxum]
MQKHFQDLKKTTHCGMPALWISKEEIQTLKIFLSLKIYGEFLATLLEPCHILIKLSNDFDYSRVFAHRAYYVKTI